MFHMMKNLKPAILDNTTTGAKQHVLLIPLINVIIPPIALKIPSTKSNIAKKTLSIAANTTPTI